MPGPVPGIHVLRAAWQDVDGRHKPGHDDVETLVRRALEPAPSYSTPRLVRAASLRRAAHVWTTRIMDPTTRFLLGLTAVAVLGYVIAASGWLCALSLRKQARTTLDRGSNRVPVARLAP